MITTSKVEGDELPYRMEWSGVHGAGQTPVGALTRVLSLKKLTGGEDTPKAIASHIFWNYEVDMAWRWIINVLDTEPSEWPLFPLPGPDEGGE